MTSPADELKAAATRLRDLAKAIDAPDLPDQSWHVEACASEERGDCPCIVAQGTYEAEPNGSLQPLFYVADAETPECAAYIAAMGPNVGTAIARWLESWTGIDLREDAPMPEDARHALTVARALNGGQP